MPLYRQLRVKWSVFHRLLSLIDTRLRYGTPGLAALLKRRRELMLGYSRLLHERGFIPGRYAPAVLLPATLDQLALMQRWKQHTQGRASARFLGEVCNHRGLKRGQTRMLPTKYWRARSGVCLLNEVVNTSSTAVISTVRILFTKNSTQYDHDA